MSTLRCAYVCSRMYACDYLRAFDATQPQLIASIMFDCFGANFGWIMCVILKWSEIFLTINEMFHQHQTTSSFWVAELENTRRIVDQSLYASDIVVLFGDDEILV